jgi:hypothetical protein
MRGRLYSYQTGGGQGRIRTNGAHTVQGGGPRMLGKSSTPYCDMYQIAFCC